MKGELTDGDFAPRPGGGAGAGDIVEQSPATFGGGFRNVHSDQYPYNAHSMLAMLIRRLLGISGIGPVGPREELMINGLKADPQLPPELYADPDISPLAVRPRNVLQPRTSY
jgi:hypothetical protein